MLNLILTILCSTSIALILKHNDSKRGNELVLLMGNYLVASIVATIMIIYDGELNFSIETLVFGLILGATFLYAFFAFAKSVSVAGTPLSSLSSRLSVAIPVALSVAVFAETPDLGEVFGFLFAVGTIILFYFSLRSNKERNLSIMDYMYLFILLLGIGFNDFFMKVFQQLRPIEEKSFFLFTIFTSAFIYTAAVVYFRKIKVRKRDFLRGNVLGAPNVLSSFFLIGALSELPGIIVYPLTNIGIILLTTILSIIIWKESLDKYGIAALALGIVAVLLLSA